MDSRALSVGIDVGGTKILGVLARGTMVVRSVRVPTRPGPDAVVEDCARVVAELAEHAAEVVGVGIGLPGLVDTANGTVSHAVNVGIGEAPLALAARCAQATGLVTRVDNDLNVAALGAARVLGLGDADIALLAVGTGLAAGMLLDGQVHRGSRGAAGEIGHIPMLASGLPCACGQSGCLETVASGWALENAWPTTSTLPAPADLFTRAGAGDARAVAVREEFLDAVAQAARVLVLTCDVATVVVGGGVAGVGEPLLRGVRDACQRQASSSPFLASLRIAERITLAPRDVPIAAVGAAMLMTDEAAR